MGCNGGEHNIQGEIASGNLDPYDQNYWQKKRSWPYGAEAVPISSLKVLH
jgi:hypothetical protein